MRVEWSDFAKEDLADIVAYISRDSSFYAQKFGEKVILAARKLESLPECGRLIPETEEEIYREIIVQGYRVMYRLEKHRVLVLAVMHGSRDLTNPDNQPWITD